VSWSHAMSIPPIDHLLYPAHSWQTSSLWQGRGVFFLTTAGEQQHSLLMRKHWSWCFLPWDCCLRNRAQSLWGNIDHGVFFLNTTGEKQSSMLMRKHRSSCLLPQDCRWETKLKAHEET
jgi:hypothetical protein